MNKVLTMALAVVLSTASANATTSKKDNDDKKAGQTFDVNTFSYAIGMAQTKGLKEYLAEQEIDTTYMDAFIKGLYEGAHTTAQKEAYIMGAQIGQQIAKRMIVGINKEIFGENSTNTISLENFLSGFADGINGTGVITLEQATKVAENAMESHNEKKYAENKKKGEDWLAANAKKPGVIVLPSGLQYKVIKEANGPKPYLTSEVEVKYEGRFVDGTVFDSSEENNDGDPVLVRPDQVIKGWTDALLMMPVGSIWELYIPYDLAYGSRDQENIKPFSALIFTIELISIK